MTTYITLARDLELILAVADRPAIVKEDMYVLVQITISCILPLLTIFVNYMNLFPLQSYSSCIKYRSLLLPQITNNLNAPLQFQLFLSALLGTTL